MKRLRVLSFVLAICAFAPSYAQQEVLSFFDKNGTIRLETQELNDAADTLITVFHRKDDVVWARMTYRVIDLRYKQNYQLYFPMTIDDPEYKSLFRVIAEAIADGIDVYRPDQYAFKPFFDDEHRISATWHSDELNKQHVFALADENGQYRDEVDGVFNANAFALYYDSVQNKIILNRSSYDTYVRNQIKFLIQEVIFFDKHTSRLHRQLIAIAPLQLTGRTESDPMEFLKQSITGWVLYHDLRPYLAKQYIIPLQNINKRVTFDDFFQKRLYTSYLVGETNIYNRMILDYAKTEESAKKEQARIEAELLNFEQDLWEY